MARHVTFEPGSGAFDVKIDSLADVEDFDLDPCVTVWYGGKALAKHYIVQALHLRKQRGQ